MESKYTYLYKNHKNRTYASEPDYNSSADVDITKVNSYKELIDTFVNAGVPFCIAHKSGATYLDIIAVDTSNENYVKFICKYMTNTMTNEIPTFGNSLSMTGLIEETIYYDKLSALIQMNPSPEGEMMSRLKEEYPEYYDMMANKVNKMEGFNVGEYINIGKDL